MPIVRAAARRSWTAVRGRPRARMRIATLGGLAVQRDGVTVPEGAFGRRKARALLAALLSAPGPIHREVLCEWLWPGLGPERAAAALRTTLHELRRALHPELDAASPDAVLVGEGDVVVVRPGPEDEIDVDRFLASARSPAAPEGDDARLARLLAAEAAHAGPYLPEWRFDDWSAARREEVADALRAVLADLAGCLAEAGRPAEAIPRLRRLVQLEPERESAHRELMRLHARPGDRALALRQFHACRTHLRRELGIDVDPATLRLYEEILRGDPAPEAGAR